ncbi:MAG: hypothetical protein ABIT58_07430 [Ferruginibacter sp.]
MKFQDILLEGSSGKLGDIVLYQRYGQTFVRKPPRAYDKTPTEKQRVNREKFVLAHRFGQFVIADPELKRVYEKKANGKCTAYSKAVSEFLKS